MQQAVLHTFPAARATYRFTHRDPAALFTRACAARLARSVSRASHPPPPRPFAPARAFVFVRVPRRL